MPPKKNKSAQESAPSLNETANEETIDFDTSNGMMMWHALSKHNYGKFQPIAELIDNAISAIQQKSPVEGSIHLNIDLEKNRGSVEHRGGITFPIKKNELSRVFSYGGKKPTKLNEHGCGINTSLAILNPGNDNWKIEIKQDDDTVYHIEAPYGDKMILKKCSSYSGQKGSYAGSFISFPISKDRFQDLYRSKEAKMNIEDLQKRIQNEMSHTWMMNEHIKNRNIKLYFNDIPIQPFSFRDEIVYQDYIQEIKNNDTKMENGGIVQVEQLKLKEKAKKGILGSNWFKFALNSNGVYLFKNGRFIEAVNGDDERKLYTRFIGNAPHNGHNGMIIIVNMIGEQDQLPSTTPTKNRFPDSAELDAYVKVIANKIERPSGHEHKSEEQRVIKFKENLEKSIKLIPGNPYPHFRIEQEKVFKINDTVNTYPLDLVVTYNDELVQIFEAKESPVLKAEYIQQLHYYWMMMQQVPELQGKKVGMNLLCSFSNDWKPTENNKYCIDLYKEAGFRFDIWNFDNMRFDLN